MNKPKLKINPADALLVLGVLAVSLGVALIFVPAALITFGVLCLVAALALGRTEQ